MHRSLVSTFVLLSLNTVQTAPCTMLQPASPSLPISFSSHSLFPIPHSSLIAELQRSSIPSFFVNLQEEGVCDMYFSYQGCQIDINSPISSVDCPKATLVISYTKPVAFKVCRCLGRSSSFWLHNCEIVGTEWFGGGPSLLMHTAHLHVRMQYTVSACIHVM